jgi:hypothetical protein
MTLQHFLTLTAGAPERDLRLAITGALLSEAPRGREAYERIYDRVVAGLGLTTETDANDTVAESQLVTC